MAVLSLSSWSAIAHAQIDGHGPDSWKVHDVAANDVLNIRMGPATTYPIIGAFEYDERGLHQVTCVPLPIAAAHESLTQSQLDALPPPWCLMRSADLSKTGWVLQSYLQGDGGEVVETPPPTGGDDMITQAVDLVRALYKNADRAANDDFHPLHPANAQNYFLINVAKEMQTQPLQADPLFGAQAFEGSYAAPVPDPDQPMLRGMITVNVEIVNFDQQHTAIFRLRADPGQPGSPIRIFRIEHDGWSFP